MVWDPEASKSDITTCHWIHGWLGDWKLDWCLMMQLISQNQSYNATCDISYVSTKTAWIENDQPFFRG